MSDTLIFASPLMRRSPEEPALEPWKILVVDDEPDIHAITKIALSDFKLDDRGITQLHAYSAREARSILQENPDIAMLLLDVVMESDGAGLDLVRYIRNVLGNKAMRIVLRTGNPGHAPERSVISEYDINDYREKSELTTQKLNTVLYTALRAYRDILISEDDKKKLEKLVEISVNFFAHDNAEDLHTDAMERIHAFLRPSAQKKDADLNVLLGSVGDEGRIEILKATGNFVSFGAETTVDDLPGDVTQDLRTGKQQAVSHNEDRLAVHVTGSDDIVYLVYADGLSAVRDEDKRLLGLLVRNIATAIRTLNRTNMPESADIYRIH